MIKLSGFDEEQGQISISTLQQVLDSLVRTAESATRLLAIGRGQGRGRNPRWLNRSIDFKVTGLRSGSTLIDIEAPTFGDTAEEVFAQADFWKPYPDLGSTALDVAFLATREACSSKPEGERFDKAVVDSIASYQRVISNSEERLVFINLEDGEEELILNQQNLAGVRNRSSDIPNPRAYTVSGILDQIEYKSGKLLLRVGDNKSLLGKLVRDKVDVETLRSLWGKPTIIEGIVHFKVNGDPRFILARRIAENTLDHDLFERMPSEAAPQLKESFKATNFDLMSLWGKWPGDETYEELIETLEAMNRSGRDT